MNQICTSMGPRLIMAALSSGLILLTSGCSGGQQGRNYSIPSTLCGIHFDADKLAEFLPGGDGISTKQKSPDKGVKQCDVFVDGKLAATTTQAWWAEGTSLADFTSGQTLKNIDHTASKGNYLYSGNEAFGKTADCAKPEEAGRLLFTAVQVSESSHSDPEAMKIIISDYTSAVEESNACR
ncbi:hypothetical protein ACIPWY_10390 [Streptomyces sp. NPDC090032]|uniref:hypothetical protein n=1 Tax=unclassified Streptomyces TaxID=2593676 RepID=UPI00372138D7